MKHYYRIYGLIIESEIAFPEALECEEQDRTKTDVVIRYGTMPDHIKQMQKAGNYYSMRGTEFKWVAYPEFGNYLMENGTTITVELDEMAEQKQVNSFLLGKCLGCILYQRGIIAIHGAAVTNEEHVFIVCGASGSGKSTVSTEFRKQGCFLLADDTVALEAVNGEWYANPSFPQQKLCKDAAIRFGYDLEQLIQLDEEYEKYALRLSEEFCNEKKKLETFVFLEKHDGEDLVIEELQGSQKLELLLENLYLYPDYVRIGLRPEVLKQCMDIANSVMMLRVKRPEGKQVASEIVEQVFQKAELLAN